MLNRGGSGIFLDKTHAARAAKVIIVFILVEINNTKNNVPQGDKAVAIRPTKERILGKPRRCKKAQQKCWVQTITIITCF